MRPIRNLNDGWTFIRKDAREININLPHTWNAFDGVDGDSNYYREKCIYKKNLGQLRKNKDELFILEFQGVSTSCDVYMNDFLLGHHDGGYSTFRFLIDDVLLRNTENILKVEVTNRKKDSIYPFNPDFTIYGGIIRDVNLITLNENHFDVLDYGSLGVDINVSVNNKLGVVEAKPYIIGKGYIKLSIFNDKGDIINSVVGQRIEITDPHLWNGLEDPYLYTLSIELIINGKVVDEIVKKIGFRYCKVDSEKGFFLNGKPYPLRGVSITQDREGLGNAISKLHIEEDIRYLKELGANTVRILHYQHDNYFLDLCDENGIVVFAEIPLQKEYLKKGNESILNQMKELIYQQKHHPSILFWNLGSQIEVNKQDYNDVEDLIKVLHAMCKAKDPLRDTMILSKFSSTPNNNLNKITDCISYDFKLGKIRPLFKVNHALIDSLRFLNRKAKISLANRGAEGTIDLHSSLPIRKNDTEEYQLLYHSHMAKFINKKPWIFAAHISSLFDYGNDKISSDLPGVDTTGLITFDHKFKKDAFYLYKAYWSKTPFVHICSKRYDKRNGPFTVIRIITNEDKIEVNINNKKSISLSNKKMYSLLVKVGDTNSIIVKGKNSSDNFTFIQSKK